MDDEVERAAGLLERLYRDGDMSEEAKQALLRAAHAPKQIGTGLGYEPTSARDMLLVSVLVDDSTSIGSLVSDIHYGHSIMLDALREESTGSTEIQILTRALNRGLLSPFRELSRAMQLTPQNFSGASQVPRTPLYLESLLTLGTVIAKAKEQDERGASVRTFTLIVTDGQDNASGTIGAEHVRPVVIDMLHFSTNHIVVGMGIGEHHDFRRTFEAMGLSRDHIITSGATKDDLRRYFRQIAQSLTLAASSPNAFYQLASGPLPDA